MPYTTVPAGLDVQNTPRTNDAVHCLVILASLHRLATLAIPYSLTLFGPMVQTVTYRTLWIILDKPVVYPYIQTANGVVQRGTVSHRTVYERWSINTPTVQYRQFRPAGTVVQRRTVG